MEYSTFRRDLLRAIQSVNASSFEVVAVRLFRFQAAFNPLYRQWVQLLGVQPGSVRSLADIPFLPISFFKSHRLQTGRWTPETIFRSSGTTETRTSRHLVRHTDWYVAQCRRGFAAAYGPVEEFAWLALLPAYLEREGSSLVAMAGDFIRRSAYPQSGFFLHHTDELLRALTRCRREKTPTVLLGVSFALLDLAEQHPLPLPASVRVMETGGMKGRRREITREELHARLRTAFGVEAIHSEYGMTELFSQAYSKGGGIYQPAPTMRVLAREITDPLSRPPHGRTGALDIVDLANLDTVAFVASEDLGRVYPDGTFEVLGRLDASDIRGCNLLVAG